MHTGERLLDRTPIVRGIYSTLKQLFETVLSQTSRTFREVVLIEYPRPGIWSVAFVTGEPPADIARAHVGDLISVFVPTTPIPAYGFLMFVARDQAMRLDMSVEEGMKLVISGGIVMPPDRSPRTPTAPAALSRRPTAARRRGARTGAAGRVAPRAPGQGRVRVDQLLGQVAGGRQQILVAAEVGEAEVRHPALAQAQHLARPTQPQILLGDDEPVVGRAQDLDPRPCRLARAASRRAGGTPTAACRARPGREAGGAGPGRSARHAR